MSHSIQITLAALLIAAMSSTGARSEDMVACSYPDAKPTMAPSSSKTATAEQPARFSTKFGPASLSKSPALQLVLRPTAADPDSPFIVQISAKSLCKGNANEQLLGSVSFYPLKLGQPQVFVLPAPQRGFPSTPPQDVELTVRLIPANPARSLEHASLEVVKAQFVE
jgi:hypothetical protein